MSSAQASSDHADEREDEIDAEAQHMVTFEQQDKLTESNKCAYLHNKCDLCTRPFRTEHNPLPENPTWCQKLKFAFLCPVHGNMAKYIVVTMMFLVTWAVLLSVTGDGGMMGGNFFSLCVLFFACIVGGYLVEFIKLPPLLGMLITGCLLQNVPVINVVGKNIDNSWSGALRQIALTVILIRAGMGLDPKALRKLSCAVLRLAFSPCIAECVTVAVAVHFLLGFPWIWGLMLGFVLAAVTPAVVVPSMMNLADKGYGTDKGIPTLVIAAASVDDVLAITGFGVMLGIAFSESNLAWSIVKGPLEAIVGVVYGIVVGVLIWFIPAKTSEHIYLYRTFLLFGFGLVATFGSSKLEFPGAGPLGCLTMAFVAALRWRKEERTAQEGDPLSDAVATLWLIFEPLLFGLIGAEVDVAQINGSTVGLGLTSLVIGLIIRMIVSFVAVWGTEFNWKERFFIPVAWLPKATVQAAIGALALDKAREVGGKLQEEILGKQILTLAALSILITAPLGAALIAIIGPMLLHQVRVPVGQSSNICEDSIMEDVEGNQEIPQPHTADQPTAPRGRDAVH